MGRWEGVAEIQNKKAKVIVDFAGGNRNLSAVISVPDDRPLGKPLINIRYQPPHLHFELQATERTIIFDGSRDGQVISGTIRGGEISAPVSLQRIGAVPPTPYKQEEVRFRNGDITLAGNRDVTIKIFLKANHTIEQAPDFLDTMLDWTVKRVRISN